MTVTDSDGQVMTLKAGDIAFFPSGSTAHWHVENYVRKVAYCQKPVPSPLGLPLRALRKAAAQFSGAVNFISRSLAYPTPQPMPQRPPEDSFEPEHSFKKTAKSA